MGVMIGVPPNGFRTALSVAVVGALFTATWIAAPIVFAMVFMVGW